MDFGVFISILIGAVFVNNIVLSKFLATCKLADETTSIEFAAGVGMTVMLVMTFSSAASWIVYEYMIVPMKIEYMRNVIFVAVIVGVVKILELMLQMTSKKFYKMLRVFIPAAAINCAVLGVVLLNLTEKIGNKSFNFLEATVYGFASSLGFAIIMIIFAAIREQLEYSDIPEIFKNNAVFFITIGIMAMAFMGFTGIKI